MRVTLQVMSGPTAGRKVLLRSGQVAQFGRTDWADFSFPEDANMADVHFALNIGSAACNLRQVGSGQVYLNGQPVTEAAIFKHDQIQAGRTLFAVDIDGEGAVVERPVQQPAAAEVPAAEAVASAPPAPQNGREMAKYLDLDEAALQLAREDQSPEQLLAALFDVENFRAAIRLQAHLLSRQSPQHAVWWAWHCVNDLTSANGSAADRSALAWARQWVVDSNEENRREAEKAAAATEYQTAAGWVAMSSFWSGGSISAPDLPEVSPDERLTGQGVTGALMLAATHDTPPSVNQRFRDMLATAKNVASGEIKLPEQ